ncbi:small subunit ribosomal protein S10e [Enteropsectra breve]|nr:small subunit ribosomal protein S10e [Enteropsectra breve]
MFVGGDDMLTIKRFLHLNAGIVVSFKKSIMNPDLNIKNEIVIKALKTLTSKQYLDKMGNWQHGWYFVTPEGRERLKKEVQLPNEKREEELLEIKI